MVPSWTETLVEAGIDVVGRTRFCIHPQDQVAKIPAVGGTKDIQWDVVEKLEPDLVLFDREENTLEMAESCPFDWVSTHVEKISDVSKEIEKLASKLSNTNLEKLSRRWKKIDQSKMNKDDWGKKFERLPGVINWLKPPAENQNIEKLIYMIWKDPWMCVSDNTFIGSVLSYLDLKDYLYRFDKKYPEIQLADFDPQKTLFLFSSEPYPFAKKQGQLKELPFSSAIVDGESFSWFGVRTMKFLEKLT